MRTATAILLLAALGCTERPVSEPRLLPVDPICDAIYARLGDPDRISGSGRAFLHYDLANGQVITLVVSGDKVVSAKFDDRK